MTQQICEQNNKVDKQVWVLQLAIILSSSPDLYKIVLNLYNTALLLDLL